MWINADKIPLPGCHEREEPGCVSSLYLEGCWVQLGHARVSERVAGSDECAKSLMLFCIFKHQCFKSNVGSNKTSVEGGMDYKQRSVIVPVLT